MLKFDRIIEEFQIPYTSYKSKLEIEIRIIFLENLSKLPSSRLTITAPRRLMLRYAKLLQKVVLLVQKLPIYIDKFFLEYENIKKWDIITSWTQKWNKLSPYLYDCLNSWHPSSSSSSMSSAAITSVSVSYTHLTLPTKA